MNADFSFPAVASGLSSITSVAGPGAALVLRLSAPAAVDGDSGLVVRVVGGSLLDAGPELPAGGLVDDDESAFVVRVVGGSLLDAGPELPAGWLVADDLAAGTAAAPTTVEQPDAALKTASATSTVSRLASPSMYDHRAVPGQPDDRRTATSVIRRRPDGNELLTRSAEDT